VLAFNFASPPFPLALFLPFLCFFFMDERPFPDPHLYTHKAHKLNSDLAPVHSYTYTYMYFF
jgi:hypothetical protein